MSIAWQATVVAFQHQFIFYIKKTILHWYQVTSSNFEGLGKLLFTESLYHFFQQILALADC